MKRFFTLLIGLIALVGTVSATDYYLGGNFEASNSWCIKGQMTDDDGDGTYSIIAELPTGYDLYFTLFTTNEVNWSTNGTTVLRPTLSNPWITNTVQEIELKGNDDTGTIHYPTTDNNDVNKNFARAILIEFTESTKKISITRLIAVASGTNGWSTTTNYIPETSFGSKIYSGNILLEADTDGWDDGFRFVYLYEGTQNYGGKKIDNGNWLASDNGASNYDVEYDGVYTLTAQFTDWVWQDPIRITATASVGSLGIGTFCSEYALDFTGITDIKAYTITGEEDGQLTKAQVTGKVKAGTGLFIENGTGEAASANANVPTTIYTTDPGTNWLKPGTGEKVYSSDASNNSNYILTTNGGSTARFFRANSQGNVVPVGKAYLQVPAENPARESMWFGNNGTTGINTLARLSTLDQAIPIYNLAGQKVSKNYKGVVIQNGKKYVIK